MSRNGMQDIRGVVKSEKAFHKYWAERQKQRERRKERNDRAETKTHYSYGDPIPREPARD